MFRAMIVAVAVLAAPPPGEVEALVAGRRDPVRFDFGVYAGPTNANARSRAERAILLAHGKPSDAVLSQTDLGGCMTASEARTYSALKAASKLAGSEDWPEARRQADDALARQASLKRHLFSGGATPFPMLRSVTSNLKSAASATDPQLAELFRRTAEDQFARFSLSHYVRQTHGAGLSEAALDVIDGEATQAMCAADQASRRFLKQWIATRPWPRISVEGPRAAHAAWLIAQHADDDVALQTSVLAAMEPLVAGKDVDMTDYAYLFDRVAVNAGRPQRYASQGRCTGPGQWRPSPLEDEANVQGLRDAAGLGSLEEYIAMMNPLCREASPPT